MNHATNSAAEAALPKRRDRITHEPIEKSGRDKLQSHFEAVFGAETRCMAPPCAAVSTQKEAEVGTQIAVHDF